MTLLYYQLLVTIFPQQAQRALVRSTSFNLWQGEGTAAVLSKSATDQIHNLPPIARYPLYRAGICIVGYGSQLAPLFYQIGGADLPWWGWPSSHKAFLAADWQYQRAVDDPIIAEIVKCLFGRPLAIHSAQQHRSSSTTNVTALRHTFSLEKHIDRRSQFHRAPNQFR